jgi:hypothetical protein
VGRLDFFLVMFGIDPMMLGLAYVVTAAFGRQGFDVVVSPPACYFCRTC